MKKIKSVLMAAVLAIASILMPVSAPVFAAQGDPMTSTVSVASGLSDKLDGNMFFDDIQLSSPTGGTANYTSTGGNHTITFGIAFEYALSHTVSAVSVNGTDTAFSPLADDRYSVSVAETSNYVIGITFEDTAAEYTVIWGNPDCTTLEDEDARIVNGYARVIGVYNSNGDPIPENVWSVDPTSDKGLKNGYGHIKLHVGDQAIFEFSPIYGYQLTSVKINGVDLTPQENTNQFIFTMKAGHAHFAATFTRTDDIVKTNSESVSGGSISLGSALDSGTAQLIVSDADVDESKKNEFNNAAGNLKISQILSVDFFNVFFKGKADSDDVWANQMHELDEEAEITLEFSPDTDVAHVALVHNINDGDDFEIIRPIRYDVNAHTATFRVKNFSNFAIATEVGAPNTGYISRSNNVSFASSTLTMAVFVSSIIAAGMWLTFREAKK